MRRFSDILMFASKLGTLVYVCRGAGGHALISRVAGVGVAILLVLLLGQVILHLRLHQRPVAARAVRQGAVRSARTPMGVTRAAQPLVRLVKVIDALVSRQSRGDLVLPFPERSHEREVSNGCLGEAQAQLVGIPINVDKTVDG